MCDPKCDQFGSRGYFKPTKYRTYLTWSSITGDQIWSNSIFHHNFTSYHQWTTHASNASIGFYSAMLKHSPLSERRSQHNLLWYLWWCYYDSEKSIRIMILIQQKHKNIIWHANKHNSYTKITIPWDYIKKIAYM